MPVPRIHPDHGSVGALFAGHPPSARPPACRAAGVAAQGRVIAGSSPRHIGHVVKALQGISRDLGL